MKNVEFNKPTIILSTIKCNETLPMKNKFDIDYNYVSISYTVYIVLNIMMQVYHHI